MCWHWVLPLAYVFFPRAMYRSTGRSLLISAQGSFESCSLQHHGLHHAYIKPYTIGSYGLCDSFRHARGGIELVAWRPKTVVQPKQDTGPYDIPYLHLHTPAHTTESNLQSVIDLSGGSKPTLSLITPPTHTHTHTHHHHHHHHHHGALYKSKIQNPL